jgi:hypothetical protein
MNVMVWMILDPSYEPDDLGFIPGFLDADDPRPAKEQIDSAYQHGGGWQSRKDFKINEDGSLSYPGDPPLHPIAMAGIRDELVVVYPHSWVVIMQNNDTFDVARID